MLGWHLRVDGKSCRYGCCSWYGRARMRKTKNERMREKVAWRKEVANA